MGPQKENFVALAGPKRIGSLVNGKNQLDDKDWMGLYPLKVNVSTPIVELVRLAEPDELVWQASTEKF